MKYGEKGYQIDKYLKYVFLINYNDRYWGRIIDCKWG